MGCNSWFLSCPRFQCNSFWSCFLELIQKSHTLLLLPSTSCIDFVDDCHLSSFFFYIEHKGNSQSCTTGQSTCTGALFLLTVQEFMEAPSSPAPERRWLAPPKIMSELLVGGGSWEGCMRDMNPRDFVVEGGQPVAQQRAFVPSPCPAGVRGSGIAAFGRFWPHN